MFAFSLLVDDSSERRERKKGKKRQKEREIFSLTTVSVFRARCKNAANKQEGCARVDSISPHKRKKLAIFDHFLCQARGADDDWL